MDALVDTNNPYQPSAASLHVGQHSSDGAYWRENDLLVTDLHAVLPPRCIKCGALARLPMKEHTYQWHHRALLLVLVLNLVIYAVIAAIVRKRAKVTAGLCDAHTARRTRDIRIAWGAALAGLVMVIAAVSADWGWLAACGGVVMVGAYIGGAMVARTLMPVRIDARRAMLKGCAPAFLHQLPTR